MSNRYQELDALRGIAAISVFLFHITMVLPDSWREGAAWNLFNLSPLHLFITGDQPVILFFVLSGFVLSLMFFSKRKIPYFSFAIKRAVRLYIPYLVAITFAISLYLMFSKGGNPNLGTLFNNLWADQINVKLVFEHFLFIGNYNVYAFNIVIWTLIHEMRISLIIPFLVLAAKRFKWQVNLALGFGLAVAGVGIHLMLKDPFQPFYKTFFYILMFIVGVLLSKNRFYLIEIYRALSTKTKMLFSIIGLVLYIYADFLINPLLIDWVSMAGVSILLVISISSQIASKILLWSPFQFLGEVSYSLYLYHLPILLSLLYIFYGKLPLLIIVGLSVPITLIVSRIAWKMVEKPSILLAKNLSNKLILKSSSNPFVNKGKEIS